MQHAHAICLERNTWNSWLFMSVIVQHPLALPETCPRNNAKLAMHALTERQGKDLQECTQAATFRHPTEWACYVTRHLTTLSHM